MKTALILLLVAPFIAAAQCDTAYYRTSLICSDIGSGHDTLWFGFDYLASYGPDPAICGEFELPPAPPGGVFDVRFVNIPGHEGEDAPAGLGQGLKQDYRNMYSPTGRDTFRIKYQPGDGGFPIRFRWSIEGIRLVSDSAWLQDEFGGFLVKARMHVVSEVSVTNPAFTSLLMITYRPTVDVQEPGNQLPSAFGLNQNYPNPFNPTTKIQFTIVNPQFTTLRVYDVLGREVATLVNEVKEPGTYTVQWDASGVSSGVYFYRLTAGSFVQTRKMVVVK